MQSAEGLHDAEETDNEDILHWSFLHSVCMGHLRRHIWVVI